MIFSQKNVRIRVAGYLEQDKKVLLVAHKKDSEIYWLLPGGGVRYGESLEEALRREFFEELSIDIQVGEVLLLFDSIAPTGKRHIINICFQCTYVSGDYKLGDDKRLYNYKFIDEEEIKKLSMYPHINDEIIDIMHNRYTKLYKGKLWLEKDGSKV